MFFARHMAIMSRSGMRIIDILKAMKKQAGKGAYANLMESIIEDIKNGQFLSDSLAKNQNLFGDFFVNIIRVGEISGTLADNLEYLAESLRKQSELQAKVKGALIYPVVILFATFGMGGGMMFFIFPKILPIFKSLKVDLPITTRIFISVSNFFINHGVLAFLGIIGFFALFFLLIRIRPLRYAWHRSMLIVPYAGTMVRDYNMVNFSRALALLLKSGVKIVQALEISANSSANLVYKAKLHEIAISVGRGEPASKGLTDNPKLFPPIFSQMIEIGEETGRLANTGNYLADYYENELDASTKAFSTILEPVLLLTMGGAVAFIALAIIQPIYAVSQGIQK